MYTNHTLIIRRVFNPGVVGTPEKAYALALRDFDHFRRVGKGVELYRLADGSVCVDVHNKRPQRRT